MIYSFFGWYLVNHHVHRVQNMYDIRGCRVSKAELRSAEVDPYFKKKIKITSGSVGKIDVRAKSS